MPQTVVHGDESLSQSVIEALASAEGVPPTELHPPLFDVIDPDALDQIFSDTQASTRLDGRVSFNYDGYRVFVGDDGCVSVESQET